MGGFAVGGVMKRAGRPEGQTATIAFLASDASFIIGQVINCSGGQP
jgi:NAD(P)-dependent dehydrogenase (short-subunit alcohol dehydrogenase family)